ncbi:DoxX family protein [Reyranella aquatilis]|uniref:DoxX family protein n=1 Tax=Reyranella aquatilis TaxID=2035356 RepID=A0ABS8KUJ4_9HYPH|nr:DoxX family protein [Reyranella aquatilis]MCC8429746.1 DoxX family protein [Reyranella aquatilis]
MISLLRRLDTLLSGIPHELMALLARLSIGTIFLRSGMLKLEGWESGTTLALFREEYQLPLLPPELASLMATAAELSLPILLFLGLFTRPAALALLGMTLVIEIFVYPNAFDTHGVWAVSLLYLAKFGPGSLALDRVILGPARPSAYGRA